MITEVTLRMQRRALKEIERLRLLIEWLQELADDNNDKELTVIVKKLDNLLIKMIDTATLRFITNGMESIDKESGQKKGGQ